MATETPAAPAAPQAPAAQPVQVTAPEIPVRQTVPVSAMFDESERTGIPASKGQPADNTPKPPVEPAKPAAAEPPKPAAGEPAGTPNEPAKPAAAPAATPAPEAKIKVGDKEYTPKELEEALAKANQPPAAPAATPAPATTPATQVQKTPEQLAKEAAEVSAKEAKWQQDFITDNKIQAAFTEAEMETILTGGKDAADLFSKKLTEAVGHAVLLARKSIYPDLESAFAKMQAAITPLAQSNEDVTRAANERAYLMAYPEYEGRMDVVTAIAQELVTQFPNEVNAMTREQFATEVERQSNLHIQRQYSSFTPTGTWKEAWKAAKAAKSAAAPAASTTPAAAAPASAATPAPAPAATAPAPAGNSPAAIGITTSSPNFHRDTAKSLQS